MPRRHSEAQSVDRARKPRVGTLYLFLTVWRRPRSVAGNVFRGSLGDLIEWYDWYAYAAFSIYHRR
jgi:hypothetical protein